MDVLCSYFHFYRSHLGYEDSFAEFFELFMRGQLQYRSWFDHVASWRAQAGRCDVLIIRYEDLQHAIEKVVRDIAAFCHIDVTDTRLATVLDKCSFSYMKQHQQKFDHITSILMERGLQSNAFIRKGRSGDGDRLLTEQQKKIFTNAISKPGSSLPQVWRLADFLH